MRRARPLAPLANLARSSAGSKWFLIAMLVLAPAAVALFLFASRAGASQPLSATIRSTGTTGTNVIQIDSDNCADASSAISDAASSPGTTYTLPVAPSGFPSGITSSGLTLTDTCSASSPSLTLEGPTTILGQPADAVVLGQWQSPSDTSPVFTIVFKFSNIDLSRLTSSGSASNLDVGLSSAWVAMTTSSSAVDVQSSILPSGYLGSDMTVSASGVSFRGSPSASGGLASALQKLGVSASDVELDGTLTGSVGSFSASAPPPVSAALSLTASITPNLPATPSWLSFTDAFSLTVDGASDGTWSVTAGGQASVTIPDSGPTTVTASIAISKSDSGTRLELSAGLGSISDAFGQNWLTLQSTQLTWMVSSSDTTATLTAAAAVDSTNFSVTFTLGTDGASAELALTSADSGAVLDARTLAGDLGLSSWPAHTPDLSVSDLDVFLQVPKSGAITVSATGTATISIDSASYSSNILLREELGGQRSLLVAASPAQQFTLSQLVGQSVSPDMTLPQLAVVFSTASFKEDSAELDPPTEAYFQKLLCTNGDACDFTVDAPAGVGITAAVTIPDSLGHMFCTLLGEDSSCTNPFSGPITIRGQIPLFGSDTTSLTVALPAVSVNAGAIQQVSVDLSISHSGGSFDFSVGGTLTLLAPGSGPNNCPTGITPPTGDVCLDLSVTGDLNAGESGVSVQLTGSLSGSGSSGWQLPDPVSWLTINNLSVQIGVTAEGGGVTLGAHGSFLVGSTDLGFSVDLEVTAEPPWVELLGFAAGSHNGLSLSDLASLYEDVSGNTVSTSGLPPVAVQNLYLSYSTLDDGALCLSQGLYISGDVVLTNGSATAIGGDAPNSQASNCGGPPAPSAACTGDKSSCLASVFLSVSTSGITGHGHLTGFSAGPLSFQPTDLDVTVSSSEVQVGISGGATLLDPVLYKSQGANAPVWARGNIDLQVGTRALALSGNVQIGALSGSISGSGSFDLTNPGFNITDFFNTLGQAFVTAGNDITAGMDTVASTADAWYSTYVAPGIASLANDINNAYQTLSLSGPDGWRDLFNLYLSIRSHIDTWNNAVDSIDLNFLEIPTDAIFNDALHGITIGDVKILNVTVVPGFTIPGLCSYDSNIEGTPICNVPLSQLVAEAQHQYADPSVDSQLAGTHLNVPSGSSEGSMVKAIHALDPPAPSSITCATSSVDYSAGTESATTLGVDSLGTHATISGPDPSQLGDVTQQTSNDRTLTQHTLDGLTSGQNTGTCAEPTTPQQPTLSLSLDRSWVYEGGDVIARGFLENSSDRTISIDWGDGTPATTAFVERSDGSYEAEHHYADETGLGGTKSPYTATATASGVSQSRTQTIAVLDQPLVLGSFSVTPGTVDVMDQVTASGAITNPEPGETITAQISWGDNTADTSVTVGSDGTFSASHIYKRLVPDGAPSRSEPITVRVAEDDGTSTGGATSVTVNDVPPSGTTLSPTSGAIVDHGTVFTHAGTEVKWAAQALDVSPEQVLSFDTNWADGTADGLGTVTQPTSGPNADNLYTYAVAEGSLAHTYAEPCLYHGQTTVTDDDTLSAPTLDTPVVVTAPLGATPTGPGYWHQQLEAALGNDNGGQVSISTLRCYLQIAQYLSPELATNLTLSSAAGILGPSLGHLSPTAKTAANLQRLLLTSLFNFDNGTWDWTQPIGPGGATYASLVARAHQALTSGSPAALTAALAAFEQLPT